MTGQNRLPSHSKAFTLVELLVVIAIIGILVALLLPAVQAAREAARRISCTNKVKNVALALHNYHDTNKAFPFGMTQDVEDGKPRGEIGGGSVLWKNWVVEILPYLEGQTIYDSIDFGVPLNDDINRVARSTNLDIFLCPTDPNSVTLCDRSGGDWARGNYAINGHLSNLGAAKSTWDTRDYMRGIASVDRSLSISKIVDGTSHTILLGEVRIGLSASDRRGTWAMGMCGSSVLCMHASNYIAGPNQCGNGADDIADARNIIKDVGRETLIQECMLPFQGAGSQQTVVRSLHPGGVVIAMADASARFLSDFVGGVVVGGKLTLTEEKFGTWQRLNSSSDGFIIDSASF